IRWLAALGLALSLISDNGLAADHQWQWAKRAGGVGRDAGTRVCLATDGALYVAGTFTYRANFGTNVLESAGGPDIFLAKMDLSGSFQWVQLFGSTDVDYYLPPTAAYSSPPFDHAVGMPSAPAHV